MPKPVSKKQSKLLHLDKVTVQKASKLCTFQLESFEIKLDRLILADVVLSSSQTNNDTKIKSKNKDEVSKRCNDKLKSGNELKTSVPTVSDIQLLSPRRSARIKLPKEQKAPAVTKKDEIESNQKELCGKGRNQIISQIQMTNFLWRELLSRDVEVVIGQVVCAKMSTYWPWPAIVTGFNRSRAFEKFFGDMKQGSVPKL